VAQYLTPDTSTPEYFLTDALGSVRQLTDVTLARLYDPYGVVGMAVCTGGKGLNSRNRPPCRKSTTAVKKWFQYKDSPPPKTGGEVLLGYNLSERF